MKVSPSLLAANLCRLAEVVSVLDPQTTDLLHMDVMDGNFVPPITFGEELCRTLSKETSIPLDIHLMVNNPEKEISKYYSIKPYDITFHYEATSFPIRMLQEIQSNGIKAGIALNPSTPVSVLEDIFPFLDLVLLMTVEPGYYGQSFLPNSLYRLEELRKLREKHMHKVELQVDGGVNSKNIQKLRSLGVDIVVAGSCIFSSEDPNAKIASLKWLE